MTLFREILNDQEGATAIEYGLIAALIAVAAITAMGALGNSLSNTFTLVSTRMRMLRTASSTGFLKGPSGERLDPVDGYRLKAPR